MSLVTWSPAIGITAVWRMAPCENTARSVVPPPMSMMQTPSSRSSSVRQAKLDASCSSTMSSTSRPQRWMHFSRLLAALSAPVTMCTLASSRTPDMPMGSRMPSWPSMMNSCGSTCRIFWSAGMATALAASTTCCTSTSLTSRSRMATTPCEFRLRTCAAGDAGEHRADLAAGHELGLFDGALDRLHGRLDVDHHAFLQAARGLHAHADHFDRVVGMHLAHQRGDFRRADVEADDEILVGSLSH